MKALVAFITFCFVQFKGISQKQFQGKVLYDIVTNNGRDSAQLELIFGNQAIKIMVSPKKGDHIISKWVIVKLDSGYIYDFDTESKTYSIKHLSELPEKIEMSRKTIAGYSATPITNIASPIQQALRLPFGQGRSTQFLADSIIYTIPEKYSSDDQLLFVNNGHLVLGTTISIDKKSNYEYHSGDEVLSPKKNNKSIAFQMEATKVIHQEIPDSEFQIPLEYLDNSSYLGQQIIRDTTVEIDSMRIQDSIPEPPPPPLPIKKSSPKKQAKPTKSPAREPE